ncbi:hypothetical protein H8702_07865 [Massilimaliae timonensis]|jgi:hypothetical protein|uniref:Uncharacterized protein n=1 Tax=Massiliimalia timonensis TaxID=1987501 RepID=A0A8J6TZA0_9FIRM|nr:hypothetical protein [Massiliimalia timonensis]MBC8611037.1 hypothetical protein [Massiliimalia timonensis]
MKGTARSLVYFKVMEQLIEALKNKCDYGSTKDIKLLSKWILNLADKFFDFDVEIISEQKYEEKKNPPN